MGVCCEREAGFGYREGFADAVRLLVREGSGIAGDPADTGSAVLDAIVREVRMQAVRDVTAWLEGALDEIDAEQARAGRAEGRVPEGGER